MTPGFYWYMAYPSGAHSVAHVMSDGLCFCGWFWEGARPVEEARRVGAFGKRLGDIPADAFDPLPPSEPATAPVVELHPTYPIEAEAQRAALELARWLGPDWAACTDNETGADPWRWRVGARTGGMILWVGRKGGFEAAAPIRAWPSRGLIWLRGYGASPAEALLALETKLREHLEPIEALVVEIGAVRANLKMEDAEQVTLRIIPEDK